MPAFGGRGQAHQDFEFTQKFMAQKQLADWRMVLPVLSQGLRLKEQSV